MTRRHSGAAALAILRNESDAEDVAQEAMLQIGCTEQAAERNRAVPYPELSAVICHQDCPRRFPADQGALRSMGHKQETPSWLAIGRNNFLLSLHLWFSSLAASLPPTLSHGRLHLAPAGGGSWRPR